MKLFLNHKLIFRLKIIILVVVAIALIGVFGVIKNKSESKSKPKPTPNPITQEENNPVTYTDFHLVIPSLGINAPVIADVDGSDKEGYFKALESGVAHYKDTAKPGEGSNIFIFGHSSYYSWSPGNYKEIFVNLPDIKKNDEISVWWQSKEYKYIVTSTKVVEPTETSVLKPTDTEQLTLMTCVPPGTAEKRLIVIAIPE